MLRAEGFGWDVPTEAFACATLETQGAFLRERIAEEASLTPPDRPSLPMPNADGTSRFASAEAREAGERAARATTDDHASITREAVEIVKARADKTRWAPYELRPILEKISATGASASGPAQRPSARSRVGTIGALGTLQVGTPLQICFQNDEGKREWFDAKVASFSHDFAYEQDGTAAGDAGSFMVDWDDGSVYQRDVPAADFRKNVRLSYYKHA